MNPILFFINSINSKLLCLSRGNSGVLHIKLNTIPKKRKLKHPSLNPIETILIWDFLKEDRTRYTQYSSQFLPMRQKLHKKDF